METCLVCSKKGEEANVSEAKQVRRVKGDEIIKVWGIFCRDLYIMVRTLANALR